MPSLTVENYLKTILLLSMQSQKGSVSTGEIAAALSVSPGSVTSMLKTLSDSSLVRYTPYEGVELTSAGRTLATRVLRRHRLLELFLSQTLHLSWDEVHEEAENMEHAVSDWLVDRIDAYLNRPQFDPHGDPIPRADGTFSPRHEATLPLTQCQPSARFRVARVVHQEPSFLRYLSEVGLHLDAEGTVLENRPEGGTISLRLGNLELTIAREAGEKILVTLEGDQ